LNDFNQELQSRLAALREQGLYRELRRVDSPQGTRIRIDGEPLLNFSSNDYLGLANDPRLKEATMKAIEDYGAGAGASRLICGSLAPHHELEEALAAFKGAKAALCFASGYVTALSTIGALVEKGDLIIIDKRVHASVVDAARLSGARLRVFAHNDLAELEEVLKWADQRCVRAAAASSTEQAPALSQSRERRPRKLIVTESVFSMDGDLAPLREIVELKDRHGAWLMLDEAHATGLYGQHRRGLAEAFELADRIEVQMGTLGKALGAAGGYICGSRLLIDFLVNRARGFIFSTAPVPAAAAAARAAVRLVQSAEGEARRTLLWQRVDEVKNALVGVGWKLPPVKSAIIPLIVGAEGKAIEMSAALRARGIFIPPVRYPAVARGEARLRLTVSATHTPADIAALESALKLCCPRTEEPRSPN